MASRSRARSSPFPAGQIEDALAMGVLPLEHASKLLGHTEHEITEKVYRRVGEVVKPTK